MTLLKNIANLRNDKGSKGVIASYILEHLESIEQLSMDEIAQETYVSKSSLVRFAQHLHFKGWKDFIPVLIREKHYEDSHYSDIDHNLPFTEQDTMESMVQKIAIIEKESIQDTADKLQTKDLERAVQLLEKSTRIVIFGLSPNNYLASVFRRKMMSIGKTVEIAQAGEFGLTANSMDKEDLALIISYSGNAPESETLRILPILQKKKVALIGLTKEADNYVRQTIETCFTICTRESYFKKIGNFSTEESILFILNTLYAAYFKSNYWKNYSYRLHILEDLEKERK